MAHFRVCRMSPCTCEVLRYAGATLIPLVVGPMEIGVGEWARVLFLKGDGWHALSDAIAQGVSFVVSMIVLRDNGISPEREGRIRRRGAFFNIVLLVGAASEVLCEAIWKFFGPTVHVEAEWAFGVAWAGLLGNIAQWWWLNKGHHSEKEEHTRETSLAHVISDLLMSIAVIVGTAFVWVAGVAHIDSVFSIGVTRIDPILSMGVALWMFVLSGKLTLEVVRS